MDGITNEDSPQTSEVLADLSPLVESTGEQPLADELAEPDAAQKVDEDTNMTLLEATEVMEEVVEEFAEETLVTDEVVEEPTSEVADVVLEEETVVSEAVEETVMEEETVVSEVVEETVIEEAAVPEAPEEVVDFDDDLEEEEPVRVPKRNILEMLRQATQESEAVESFYRPLEMDLEDLAPEKATGATAAATTATTATTAATAATTTATAAATSLLGSSEGGHKCRPLSLQDYYARLETFKPGRWFAKPMAVNPIQCVRRGWKGTGRDTIECVCCGEELTIIREGDIWIINGKPFDNPPGTETLIDYHSNFCPWRCHDVSLTDPGEMSDRMILEATEYRLAALRAHLRHVPVLAPPNEDASGDPEQQDLPNLSGASEEDPFECLARAGWEIDHRHKEQQQQAATGLDIVRCFFCLRSVAIQSFPHRHVEVNPKVVGEPPAKRRKRASSSTVVPPQAGLWTPKPGGDATEPVKMDPHSLHRYYCPMYSSVDEDLSPLARRLIEVRIKALNGLLPELGGAREPETSAPVPPEEPETKEEDRQKKLQLTLSRAQELLASLQNILPVE